MGSRVHKWANIFMRANGLLRHEGLRIEDKPLWYDIYKSHPPLEEPEFDKKPLDIKIKEIFYSEDKSRAKVHQNMSHMIGFYDLNSRKKNTKRQMLMEAYNEFISAGFDEKEAFKKIKDSMETAVDSNDAISVTSKSDN